MPVQSFLSAEVRYPNTGNQAISDTLIKEIEWENITMFVVVLDLGRLLSIQMVTFSRVLSPNYLSDTSGLF